MSLKKVSLVMKTAHTICKKYNNKYLEQGMMVL